MTSHAAKAPYAFPASKRELKYRNPKLITLSRKLPEVFGYVSKISVRTKQASCRYSRKTHLSRLLPKISAENLSPCPVLKSLGGRWSIHNLCVFALSAFDVLIQSNKLQIGANTA